MNQSVYVIRAEGGPVKVGIAINPWTRLYDLQSTSVTMLSLEFAAQCAAGAARKIEAQAHKILAQYHHAGEWFNSSVKDAMEAIEVAAAYEGEEISAIDVSRPAYGMTVQLRMPQDTFLKIDEWRATQRPIPNRSEAIRLLVEQALSSKR